MNWFNLIILIVLCGGHTQVVVMLINRLHARPIPPRVLRGLRYLHDVLVVGFPILLFWRVGFGTNALLADGSWSTLSLGWMIYLGVTLVGATGFTASVVRWWIHRPPRVQLSNHSQMVDIAAQLGFQPSGTSRKRWLAHLPGNEIFKVELSEKHYRLPRWPREWDGLSIVHLSDTHLVGTPDKPYFVKLCELASHMKGDLLVFTGDLLDDLEHLDWLPETLGKLEAPLGRYFILGNHDWYLDAAKIRGALVALGWESVAGRVCIVEPGGARASNRRLVIGGTESPWIPGNPDFSTQAADAIRLLLSHTPDCIDWARRQRVDLMLSGHNHGGQIILPVIGPVYAPSRYGVRYSGGAFWCGETLLYVTRGIGGRTPLRFNCPPELTKLVLHTGDE